MDYTRHGTLSLFVALDVATILTCMYMNLATRRARARRDCLE